MSTSGTKSNTYRYVFQLVILLLTNYVGVSVSNSTNELVHGSRSIMHILLQVRPCLLSKFLNLKVIKRIRLLDHIKTYVSLYAKWIMFCLILSGSRQQLCKFLFDVISQGGDVIRVANYRTTFTLFFCLLKSKSLG